MIALCPPWYRVPLRLTTGDGPNELKEVIAYFGDKVYVLKVPHHGNSCSMSNAQAVRKAGCIIAYETNIESKGPGTTVYTALLTHAAR